MFGIDNPEIGLMFQVFSGMCGLPNDQIAALLTVGVMYSLREKPAARTDGSSNCPKRWKSANRELGGQMLLKSEVEKSSLTGKGTGYPPQRRFNHPFRNIISTIDIKLTWKTWWVWIYTRAKSGVCGKLDSVRMTTSTFTVNLGIDNADILTEYGLPCGYGLVTMGNDAYAKLFPSCENNEFKLSTDCFYLGYSCPPPSDREKTPFYPFRQFFAG